MHIKTDLKKILVCLLLTVFFVKGYGQTGVENRFLVSVEFPPGTIWDDDKNRFRYHITTVNGAFHEVFTERPQSTFQHYALINMPQHFHFWVELCSPGRGISYVEQLKNRFYDVSFNNCGDNQIRNYRVIVEGPLVITRASFGNGATSACPENNIILEFDWNFPRNEWGQPFFSSGFAVQGRNDNGAWRHIGAVTPGFHSSHMAISYATLIASGLNPYQNIHFRTIHQQADGVHTTSTTPILLPLRYHPLFSFPSGRDVIIETPVCYGDNTIIRIPFEAGVNYNITIQRLVNNVNYGNPIPVVTEDLEQESGYFVLSRFFNPGTTHRLEIANRENAGTTCVFRTIITTPIIQPFTITNSSVAVLGEDNNGNPVHMITRGGRAPVYFDIANSRSSDITLRANAGTMHGTVRAQGQLGTRTVDSETGIAYYSGRVSINLPAGTYPSGTMLGAGRVSVENSLGCSADYAGTVTVSQPAPITFEFTHHNPMCANDSGRVMITSINGGMGAYRYRLLTLPPINIFPPDSLFPIFPGGITQANNNNLSDIVWIPIAGTPFEITGIEPGRYQIIVDDNYGNGQSVELIVLSREFTINPPPSPISLDSIIIRPPTMFGMSDGTAEIIITEKNEPYEFSRNRDSGFQSQNLLTGFSSGEHTVYVKDGSDCVFDFEIYIPHGRRFTVETDTLVAPTCNGDDDGSAVFVVGDFDGTLSVFGVGFPQDSVTISGNIIRIGGLRAETYSVKITETIFVNSQEFTQDTTLIFTIPVKSPVSIEIVDTIQVSDKGSSTGAIHVRVSGGNAGGYTVYLHEDAQRQILLDSISGVTEFAVFENLRGTVAGKSYFISARDSRACRGELDNVIIREPADTLRLSAFITKPISCFKDSDAEITLRATGGWGEYQFSQGKTTWTTDSVFQGFAVGTHRFYVKDRWNGTDSVDITVSQPTALAVELDSIVHVFCHGDSTGILRYRVSGGTYPYFYQLNAPFGTITPTIINGDTLVVISGLPAGVFQLTVTDYHGCQFFVSADTITEPTALQLFVQPVIHTTCEQENGILTATAIGGVYPYTFRLTDPSFNYIRSVTPNEGDTVRFDQLPPGQYRIIVTDSKGCEVRSDILTIEDYVNPVVQIVNIQDVDCFGGSNGAIEVFAQRGTADIDFFELRKLGDSLFVQRNTSGVFENLRAGNYHVFVFDENGCVSDPPFLVRITEPDLLTITIDTIIPVIAKGEQSGQVHLRVQGGAEGRKMVYLKNLDNVIIDSVSAVNNLQAVFRVYAGTYYLEVVDRNGCIATTAVFTVVEPSEALRLIVVEQEDARCKAQTGRIVVQGVGGWGEYRYRRVSDGQFSSLNRFENLYAGSYLIEVTDQMGAIYRKSVVIHEPQDSLRAEIVNLQAPTCGNNGSISIRLLGGTPPYMLSNGADTLTYSASEIVLWQGFASGAQLFHLTDANGCRFELEAFFPETSLLKIERFEVLHPSTSDTSDGKITAIVSGGIAPPTYQWRKKQGSSFEVFGGNSPVLENIGSGYYVFSVTDAGGCRVEEIIYLADPDDRAFEIIEIGDETSFEAENGFAVLFSDADLTYFALISERQEIFEFEKTDVTNRFRIENDTIYLSSLRGGRWFFMGISDDFEKRYVTEFRINPFPEFIFSRTAVTPVAAKGDSTGIIRVEVQGGGGGNIFTWTNSSGEVLVSTDNEFISVIENLPAGIYTVSVEDRFGNRISQNVEVQEPAERLTISLVEQKNQDCKNDENAYVILSASGGWGDYQFRHDAQIHFNNASSFTNLPTRNNYFYLIDRMGVIERLRVEITEPEYLRATVAFVDSVKCNGNLDGSILFEITGGTPPYRFREIGTTIWTEGNLAERKSAGWHTFIFTDSNNCIGQDTLTVYVPEPDLLLFREIRVTHTTCNLDNGQISVSMQGGTRPYRFSWLDYNRVEIGTDSIITDLRQNGVYRLIVTDANGCTQEFEQRINPSTLPRILRLETTEVLCYGGNTGTARVIDYVYATPFAPYRFIWSNGDTGDFSPRFEAGTHHVRIEDDNGCATVFYFEITQPEPLRLNFVNVRQPQCHGDGNGFIGTEVTGGRGNYTYLWSTGATTPYIEHLFKGDYWVEITDENGCVLRREIFLDQPEYKTLDLGEDISICPNNTVVIDGQDFAAHRWFTAQGDISNERFLSVSRQGFYFLEATDENGCPVWGSIFVSVGNQALIADMLLPSEASVGDTLFVVELSNMELDSIVWLYNPQEFRRITVDNEFNLPYAAHFVCLQAGVFEIGLHAFAQGCFSPVFKQIEVVETNEIRTENWAVRQPLIISVNLFPNPTDGEFTVELELREEAEVNLTLFDVGSGTPVNQRTIQAEKLNRIEYYLRELNTGTYVLLVTAGNERRQITIIVR